MKWTELEIESPDRLTEALSNYLMEQGAEGVWEEGSFPSYVRAYFLPEAAEAVQVGLDVYINELKQLYPRTGAVHYRTRTVKREAWADKWKEYFQPQALGKNFYLVPKWKREEAIPSDLLPIVLDPGMAFGTGLHESTRLCVGLMEGVLKQPVTRLLDAGTGSGILAIVASKLGVSEICAIDIDPIAVEVAEENCQDNGCDGISFSVGTVEQVAGPFDVLVANILLEAHLQSVATYAERLRPGGALILSGLLCTQRDVILRALNDNGFSELHFEEQGEWLACLAYKPN